MKIPTECALCRKNSGSGINVLGKFICSECEKTLMNIEVYNAEYEDYKDLIKKNIYGEFILETTVR